MHNPKLPVLGDRIAEEGDGLGTVAFIEDGKRYFGLNGDSRNPEEYKFVIEFFKEMKAKGGFEGFVVFSYPQGASKFLSHAEAHAIIAYYKAKGGKVPSSFEGYVDRLTCNLCTTYLPVLLRYLKIKKVVFHSKDGKDETVYDVRPE